MVSSGLHGERGPLKAACGLVLPGDPGGQASCRDSHEQLLERVLQRGASIRKGTQRQQERSGPILNITHSAPEPQCSWTASVAETLFSASAKSHRATESWQVTQGQGTPRGPGHVAES